MRSLVSAISFSCLTYLQIRGGGAVALRRHIQRAIARITQGKAYAVQVVRRVVSALRFRLALEQCDESLADDLDLLGVIRLVQKNVQQLLGHDCRHGDFLIDDESIILPTVPKVNGHCY